MKSISFLLLLLNFTCFSQIPFIDLNYGVNGYSPKITNSTNNTAYSIILPDESIIMACSKYNVWDISFEKISPNGTLDTSFGTNGIALIDSNLSIRDYVYGLTLQNDGKIIAVGRADTTVSISTENYDVLLIRINSDGTRDNTFGVNGIVKTSFGTNLDIGRSVKVDSNGKIIVAGTTGNEGFENSFVARYNSDGSLDTSFASVGYVVVDYTTDDRLYDVLALNNSKIIVGGFTRASTNNLDFFLKKFNENGTPDNSFGLNGVVTTDFNLNSELILKLALKNNNKLIALGDNYNGSTCLAQYNIEDGSLDTSFSGDGKAVLGSVNEDYTGDLNNRGLVVLPNDDILISGFARSWQTQNFSNDVFIRKVTSNGNLDESFGVGLSGSVFFPTIGASEETVGLHTRSDGKAILTFCGTLGVNEYANSPRSIRLSNVFSNLSLGEEVTNKFIVYPNPCNDYLNINDYDLIKKAEVYTLEGKLIKSFQNNLDTIIFKEFNSGIYLLKLYSHIGEVFNLKLIKQ